MRQSEIKSESEQVGMGHRNEAHQQRAIYDTPDAAYPAQACATHHTSIHLHMGMHRMPARVHDVDALLDVQTCLVRSSVDSAPLRLRLRLRLLFLSLDPPPSSSHPAVELTSSSSTEAP